MLDGKRLLITGVLTRRSIAFAVAREAQLAGAEVLLTGFGRSRRMTERAAERLPNPADVLELDIDSEADLAGLATELDRRWGGLDGALHAIAFAPEDAIGGHFMTTPAESAAQAFRISAYSFQALARHLEPLLVAEGGSLVGLDFDASVAWPSYDWMGVSKAALEAVNRYVARELGPRGIRVNLISAGPISSPAAGGISGFDRLAGSWDAAAPLGWDTADAAPIAEAVCFLFSESSRAISGELIHVDGGAHAVAPTVDPIPRGNGRPPAAVDRQEVRLSTDPAEEPGERS
ncbi:MAG: enoyl-ACP reductase FabI [Solirubrobacterales bacterium]